MSNKNKIIIKERETRLLKSELSDLSFRAKDPLSKIMPQLLKMPEGIFFNISFLLTVALNPNLEVYRWGATYWAQRLGIDKNLLRKYEEKLITDFLINFNLLKEEFKSLEGIGLYFNKYNKREITFLFSDNPLGDLEQNDFYLKYIKPDDNLHSFTAGRIKRIGLNGFYPPLINYWHYSALDEKLNCLVKNQLLMFYFEDTEWN